MALILSSHSLFGEDSNLGISSNPGAVNIQTGTGELGKFLGIEEETGITFGGLLIEDGNWLMSGGSGLHHNRRWTGNSLFILDLLIDLEKSIGWKGALFGADFLQFNGQTTNADAGVVQGYNSLPGPPPLNRSELYELWLRQELFDKKLTIRIGKTVPTNDFNNVLKPVPVLNVELAIPEVSGLIYTPIFVNTTLLGVIPGYYNSACGVTVTVAPNKATYISAGAYDGNLARGVQTGLTGPHFNGYYFTIAEMGYAWTTPEDKKPGNVALGGWRQIGRLGTGAITENGAAGIYAFGAQCVWMREPGTTKQGSISAFFQLGWNGSKTLPMNRYAGLGFTGFALIPSRPQDSLGAGIAWSKLNKHIFERSQEWMFQAYYQAHIINTTFLETAFSYVPKPGATDKINTTAWTARIILLF